MPELELGEDQIICMWQTAELDANIENGVSYLWSPGGQTTATIVVDSTGVGIGSQTYTVMATDENGCVVEDEITITFDACTSIDEKQAECLCLS